MLLVYDHGFFLVTECTLFDDGDCQPGNSDTFTGLFLSNIRLPDLGAPADVQRRTYSDDIAFRYRPDMVGIDLDTDSPVLLRVDRHPGGYTAQRFGQHTTGAAVQNTERLSCAMIDRHAGLEKIRTDFQKANTDIQHRKSTRLN